MTTNVIQTYNGALLSSKAPNLPIAPVEYTQQYMDQVLNALRLYFNQIDNFNQGINTPNSGTTDNRPVDSVQAPIPVGQPYYDTTISTLLIWNGSAWVSAIPTSASPVTSFSAGSTGFTPSSATTGAVTLAGTLGIANGGTGITSFGTGVQTALGQNITGSGSIVLGTSPTIGTPTINNATMVAPALGTPASGNLSKTTNIPVNQAVGQLPAANINSGQVTNVSLATSAKFTALTAYQNSGQTLSGDSGWVDHLSLTFTTGVACRVMVWGMISISYESGAVQGFMKLLMDGTQIGYIWCAGKQSTANSAAAGSGCAYVDVSAGSHTVKIQARNSAGGTTWITPYWNVDGQGANSLGVMYYG